MPNNYYERLSEMNPGELADGLAMEQEFDAISRGFAKLPTPHRDGHGFEGPTRVGDPVEKYDAINLGSLEKLNLPIYRKKITTEDWNSIIDPGIYDVFNAVGNNVPNAYPYGVLTVRAFNGVVSQEYVPDKFSALVKRSCTNIASSEWVEWDYVYSSSMGLVAFKNRVINGDFKINQRGYSSGAQTSAGQYTLDRWKVSSTQGISFSKVNGVTVVTIPQGQTIKQVIESGNIQPGDYILSWKGTAKGRIGSGEYGDSGKVKASLQSEDITIEFSSGTLSQVQLELGYYETKFEWRHIAFELTLCQRYFEFVDYHIASMNSVIGNDCYTFVPFKVTKRVVPTSISATDISNNGYPHGAPSLVGYANGVRAVKTANGNSSNGFYAFSISASSEL